MNAHYTDYSEYLTRFFGNTKVQKISVNTGAGCPNRDGTIGTGGCIYCDNRSFTPSYCFKGDGVAEQIEAGKRFFAGKYPRMKFLAYFQSYTGTHRQTATRLERIYREAIECRDIAGLVIGTRPDCMPDDVADMLSDINATLPVFVELGVETLRDDTLSLLNRGHDSRISRDTIVRLADRGLHVGAHLILGLPGEEEKDFINTISDICRLPIESLKLHHLQILKGTRLEELRNRGMIYVHTFTVEEYVALCARILSIIPRRIAVERFLASAPPDMVVSPRWGLKNYQFANLLNNYMDSQGNMENNV